MQKNNFKQILIYLLLFYRVLLFSFQFKKKAKELGANSEDYAQAVLHLINPTTRKKTVTKKSNPCKALFFEDVEESHYDMENELGITIQESTEYGPVGQRHPPISKALHDDVKVKHVFS